MKYAQPNRGLVSTLATVVQFLEKESNSHYHAHSVCLVKADATFSGAKHVVLPDVKENFTKGCTLRPVLECQQKCLVVFCLLEFLNYNYMFMTGLPAACFFSFFFGSYPSHV